jgi:recombination protein U
MKFAGICNPCDFIIYRHPFLFLWELKSHKGKSIPLSAIREQQLKKLTEIDKEGVSAGFILNFRDLGETYWVEATKVKGILEKGERKSISVEWCRTEGVRIEQTLKRSRYYYDISRLLKELEGSLSFK